MKIVESLKIKEKVYIEKLKNGLTIMIIPKKTTNKKFVIWGTHFGSINNHFIVPNTNEEITLPDGVAHFLEHKMFEQENGINSLDKLMALGVDPNAYTTNNHTAYYFECTTNFEQALDELMDYVQHPYFTDENIEKEKGIIGQEIKMYEDDPGWQLYIHALECMYQKNPIKIDIAGTVESISKIDKDILYKSYETFYHPSNMAMVICGNFVPEEILEEVKKRLIKREEQGEIRRIYEEEDSAIQQKYKETFMEVSTPLFAIGFKDKIEQKDIIKRHIAIEILLNMLIGKSASLYQELYSEGLLMAEPDISYDFSEQYAYVLITGQSKNPKKIEERLKEEIKRQIENFDVEQFERLKRKVYGDFVVEYNNISDISRMFLSDFFKGINSLEYIEQYGSVSTEYTKQILTEVFDEKNEIMSIVQPKG